ncbi:MAG: hypothetical protein WC438_04575 [Candidatus Pacearchaeota archaeon]
MKTKKHKHKTSNKKKFFGALALAMLVVGGALAVPTYDSNQNSSVNVLKNIQQNPADFLNANNLFLEKDFDYLKELNKEFAAIINEEQAKIAVNEGAITKAMENEDYAAWQTALKSLNGYPEGKEIMTQEDFEILSALHKNNLI